jgi:hypothetical protein
MVQFRLASENGNRPGPELCGRSMTTPINRWVISQSVTEQLRQ